MLSPHVGVPLWLVLLSVSACYGLVISIWYLNQFVSWVFRKKNRNLNKYGANNGNSWAVITGASSGIGEKMVYEMCKTGFNLVIIARREAYLRNIRERIADMYPSCVVKIVLADLSKSYETNAVLMADVRAAVGEGEIRILMHFAGNSDLSVHLTDKSIDRNIQVMRLVVESTLVLVQKFTELMCTCSKGKKCAIMTCGALTGYTPAPTFAASSANKHYVRALTQSMAAEYEYIDFMIAHPIAVKSEILNNVDETSNVGGFIINSDEFVKNIVEEMGYKVDLNGHWKHDMLVFLLCEVLPLAWVQRMFYKQRVAFNSHFLQRPIDSRNILEKF